ncbi:MAG: hypothetical protein EA398_10635 [Deltaproteobacteria bacterium]|nr:MAG: hypothetical protein EA398_10635 [Deltaproteobacteria bacterium]
MNRMARRLALLLLLTPAVAALAACGSDDSIGSTTSCAGTAFHDPEHAPCDQLSQYALFDGTDDRGWPIPAEGTFVYTLNSSLFSDDTLKLRTIRLPEGAGPMRYQPDLPFDFPVGTIITKTFAVGEDLRDPDTPVHLLETRLLIRRADEWFAAPYEWDDENRDARHRAIGRNNISFSWIDAEGQERSTDRYTIPARTECGQCHRERRDLDVIGPKARHLNGPSRHDPSIENQLTHWAELGLLEGLPDDLADVPRNADAFDPHTGTLDERARAWLDINCAHCHNDTSEVASSGLDLRPNIDEARLLGVCKTPSAAGADGTGGLRYDIIPGDPDRSILVYRMSVDASNTIAIMPRLARSIVDEPALALIRDWVEWLGTEDAENRYPGITRASCIDR